MAVGKFKLALKDYEAVKTARPRDKDALTKYTECNKIVRRLAFEKAISVGDTKKPSETIDLESMGKEVRTLRWVWLKVCLAGLISFYSR